MEGFKMKKILFMVLVIAMISASAMEIPANENSKAPDMSQGIGPDIGRIDFIHYAKPYSPAKPRQETCYKLMGIKWNTLPVSYVINPANDQGLSELSITSAIYTAAETWDAASTQELFNNAYTIDNSAAYPNYYDYKNAIVFGSYTDSNVIAVTSVWYNRRTKEIVQFDMLLNTYYQWGFGDALKMDVQNIVTHELGHSLGLSDIYSTACAQVTMYGYSWEGDFDKSTLEAADKAGIKAIYGT
jgi:hypothetical protein